MRDPSYINTWGLAMKGRGGRGPKHLEEAVVAEEERWAVDAEIEDAVVAGGDAEAHGRGHQLQALAPLHL